MKQPLEDLRSHVVPSSRHLHLSRNLPSPNCCSKIYQFDMVVSACALRLYEDYIVQLDISMNYALLMEVGQGRQQLLCYADHQHLWKLF